MATITLPISLSASINVQADDDHGGLRDVEWIQDLSSPTQQGFYGNRAEKIIFFRDKTKPEDAMGNYWVAWQDGVSVEQMQKVKWEKYEYRDMNNLLIKDEGWVSVNAINNRRKIWMNNAWNENTVIINIFDPISKQYVQI